MAQILKEVYFNDGEGIDVVDFNNMQRFQSARLIDAILGGLATQENEDIPTAALAQVYSIGNGGAVWADPAVTRKVRFAEGMILAPAAATPTIDGNSPKMLGYYMKEADVSNLVRPAVANPGDERWDILSVLLAESTGDSETRDSEDAVTDAKTSSSIAKRRRVTATFTWTSSAESASPSEPSTPAGELKLCAVLVKEGMTTFGPNAFDMRDYRIPLGRTSHCTLCADSAPILFNSATYSVNSNASMPPHNNVVTNGGGGTERAEQYFTSPVRNAAKRLRDIYIRGRAGTTANHTLNLRADGATGTPTVLHTSNAIVPTSLGWAQFAPTIPIWSNGNTAGYAAEKASASPGLLNLEWEVNTGEAGAQLHEVLWRYYGL